jgi:DNA-binding transcriptional LysR family regulator
LNLPSLDIRLLFIFAEMMKQRSVGKVADALNMPQPSVSRNLTTLREHFGDQLFVRTRNGMEPTPAALAMADAVEEVTSIYRARLIQPGVFDPMTSRREFTIAASDLGHMLLLPLLLRATASEAPNVRFTAVPLGARSLLEGLESGEIDLAFGGFPNLYAGVLEQTLFAEHYVCLVRRGHPIIDGGVTLEQFLDAGHIIVAAHELGHSHQTVEKRLLEICPADKVRVVTRNFLIGALLADRTDLVFTVPSRIVDAVGGRHNYSVLKPPLDLPGFDAKQYWHARFHEDPGNRWLRRTISGLF